MPVLESKFASDSTVTDDSNSLFSGKGELSTPVLAIELSDTEEEVFYVDDATTAPTSGFAIIDDEVIQFSSRFGISEIRYLQRGINSTTPAVHLIGAAVKLTPHFYIPDAFRNTIIAMQEFMIAQKAITDDHESRLSAIEP